MKRMWRVFSAFLRVQIGVMFQYRGEILLWAIWGLVNPIVLCAMWSAAAEGQPGKTIAGFTQPQLAAYYFAIMLLGHFSTAWDAYEMGYLIRSGSMSSQLLKPVLPIWQALAGNLAYKIVTLPFLIPMWLIYVWWVRPEFSAGPLLMILGIIAVILACLMSFILGYVIALIAFWSPQLDAAGEIYFGLGMFLGGRFAPLSALPDWLLLVTKVLPFRWMFAFPAELLVGKITNIGDALMGLTIQSLWILGIVIAFKLLWHQAIKKYTAVGG
jgi:ABC-2 type transport system permease protein